MIELFFLNHNNQREDDNYNMKTDNLRPRPFNRKAVNESQEQFKSVIEEMLKSHEKCEITFNEFMLLLGKYNIKFYSPEEFKKMSKIFNNTFHVLSTNTPFQYLEYHSKQVTAGSYYYLVKILHKKIDIYTNDRSKKRSTHSVDKCMNDFVIVMKKRYGNEINWFKVLGGMTVAVSIEAEVFKLNLMQIMRNTSHHQCIEQIITLFIEPNQKIIMWSQFMFVIKHHIKKIAENLKSTSKNTFQRNVSSDKDTELSQPYLTVKSKFFQTDKTHQPSKNSLRKGMNFCKSEYGTKRWTEEKQFFKSRCRTQGTEQLELKLTLRQCPIYSKTKASVSYTECSDIVYPLKKNTISLPINEKRMQRNHFLWKYLKSKLELE